MRNVIFGLFILVVSLALFSTACGNGGEKTVRGEVVEVLHVSLDGQAWFGLKKFDAGPATLVVVQDENENHFLRFILVTLPLKKGCI